jgi:NADPH-dependent 2,4-dienoyl-CoA reductase/sulfur reductase-like enzyme
MRDAMPTFQDGRNVQGRGSSDPENAMNKLQADISRQSLDGIATGTRILVIGGGFAGIEVAKELGRAGLSVTLIDRQNHHLFQPLLYQVATAALSAPDVAELRKRAGPARRSRRNRHAVENCFARRRRNASV